MKGAVFMWSYENISKESVKERSLFVENVIEKLGAEFVCETKENGTQKVWKFRNKYVRVDSIGFEKKPFIVLEFSDNLERPYEDSDPFPYDLPDEEMVLEVKYSLGILPYPEWKDMFRESWGIPPYAYLMARSSNYIIYNEYEDAYLKNVNTKEVTKLGDYYGDPQIALIDSEEKFCVIAGYDSVCIYFIEEKKVKLLECKCDWIDSINQDNSQITIIFEDGTRKFFDVYEV